jgi:hypothetical protein
MGHISDMASSVKTATELKARKEAHRVFILDI